MTTLTQLEQDIKDEVAKLEKLVGDDLAYLKAKLHAVFTHTDAVVRSNARAMFEQEASRGFPSHNRLALEAAVAVAEATSSPQTSTPTVPVAPVVPTPPPQHVVVVAPLSNPVPGDSAPAVVVEHTPPSVPVFAEVGIPPATGPTAS